MPGGGPLHLFNCCLWHTKPFHSALTQVRSPVQLFARELARGWTSAGNDTLAFQRLGLFEKLGRL